jgi:hypothetical protein
MNSSLEGQPNPNTYPFIGEISQGIINSSASNLAYGSNTTANDTSNHGSMIPTSSKNVLITIGSIIALGVAIIVAWRISVYLIRVRRESIRQQEG